jgi:branched-chain amino acid transport system ATP-binding protein
MAEALLELRNVRAGYGDAVVCDDISLTIPENGSVAVLGRNGVGKSTLLLTIMGFTQVSRGSVHWRGQDISKLPAHSRARIGIGWVAQEREIFPSLTVVENLTVAARSGRWDLDAIFGLFPRLAERRQNMGNQLSGGEQQMLAIARALARDIKLLLLDEPYEGLAPVIVQEIARTLAHIREQGITTIIVEQNAIAALKLADRAVILDTGTVVFDGTAAEVLENERLRAEYLAI